MPDEPAHPLEQDAALVTDVVLPQCFGPQSPPHSFNMNALFVSLEPACFAIAEVAGVTGKLTADSWKIRKSWGMSNSEVPGQLLQLCECFV